MPPRLRGQPNPLVTRNAAQFIVVGERTNITGSPRFGKAIKHVREDRANMNELRDLHPNQKFYVHDISKPNNQARLANMASNSNVNVVLASCYTAHQDVYRKA